MNRFKHIAVVGFCLALVAWSYESSEETLKKLAVNSPNVVFRTPIIGKQDVTLVSIGRSTQDFERALPLLRDLRGLQTLQLRSLPLSARNMDAISKLKITNLSISRCATGAQELSALASLQSLEKLTLFKVAGANDKGISQLRKIDSLKEMDLSFSPVTGLCFANGFERLEKLQLTGCPVDDNGLKAVAKLSSLRQLGIGQTNVTGESLIHLAGLHSLEQVGLPHGIPLDQVLAARRAHIRAKQEARNAGIKVPADSLSPFIFFEQKANAALIKAKQKERKLPRVMAKKVARVEMAIIWLLGRENAPLVLDQVDDANFQAGTSTKDYTTSTRSLAEIFKADFGLPFQTAMELRDGFLTPEKEKTIRAYLSGKLFPAEQDSE